MFVDEIMHRKLVVLSRRYHRHQPKYSSWSSSHGTSSFYAVDMNMAKIIVAGRKNGKIKV